MSFAEPSIDNLRQSAARLISDALIVFPVRHHSPACALHLLRLFAERPPSVVLVEGPRSFTPLIASLTHADARAPLAIYSYAVQKSGDGNDRRMAAYYPFSDYSPELVALREAARLGVPARFIDLDFTEQSVLEPTAEDDEARSLLDEQRYRRSHYLQALATQLGCRDHEELWEHLFEATAAGQSLQAHVDSVATYCALARTDNSDDELRADGTLQREAEMAWHIREALARRTSGEGPVLAVMGGFHAVAMPDLLANPPARPRIAQDGITDAASAIIRYSFERLDRLNGYSAGMTSPAWHQRLWERQLKHERIGSDGWIRLRQQVTLDVLFEIAEVLRVRHAIALPMPALGAAYEQALRLAALRGRAAPLRNDVLDAVSSCFIKGDADSDGLPVRAAALRVLGGTQLGVVPPGTGAPPLVRDFEMRARRQRLKLDDPERRKLNLDIYRRPEHRVTSRLLHGLALLAIPFATRLGGPDFVNGLALGRLQEQWEYSHSPATEAALVEASLYGVTLPLAVANCFVARLDRLQRDGQARDARAASKMLVQACVLGLHDHLPRVTGMLRTAIAEDADFAALTAATTTIALLWEAREPLEANDIQDLPPLLRAAYERAVYLGANLQGNPPEALPLLHAMAQLRELLVSAAGNGLDASLYWQMVESLDRRHPAPIIRGACAGLRYTAGLITEQDLADSVQGHLNGMLQPGEAVSYVRGLLHVAREVAWQSAAFLEVLDRLLTHWTETEFVACVPELRLAFASMTPRETDRIAEAVAGLHNLETLGGLVSHALGEPQLLANLALSESVLEVLAGDGLAAWGRT